MRRRLIAPSMVALVALVVSAGAFLCAPELRQDAPAPSLEADDLGYEAGPQDLQLPELPTGCEATALSTLLRLNGIDASKTDVADAMPRSDADFVNAFWGNPYSATGGCAMAPCVADTAGGYLHGTGLAAYETEGRELADLPVPSIVWVTIDLADPQGPIKVQGAYEMYYPSHCVVLLGIVGDDAHVIDPLNGRTTYPLNKIAEVYDVLGRQAVYLGEV